MRYAMTPADVRLQLEEIKRRRAEAMGQQAMSGMEMVRGGILDIDAARQAREALTRKRQAEDEERRHRQAEEERRQAAERRREQEHQYGRAKEIVGGADLHAASVGQDGPQPYQRGVEDSVRSAGIGGDVVSPSEVGSLAGRRAESVEESRRAREAEQEKMRIQSEAAARAERTERRPALKADADGYAASLLDQHGDNVPEQYIESAAMEIGGSQGLSRHEAAAFLRQSIAAERARRQGINARAAQKGQPSNKMLDKAAAAKKKAQFFDDVLRVEKDLGVWTHPFRTAWEKAREFITGASDEEWSILNNLLSPEFALQIREMGGAHLSDNEKRLYSEAMPTISDSPERRRQKLHTLKAMMERDAHFYATGELLPLDLGAIAPWYKQPQVAQARPGTRAAAASQPDQRQATHAPSGKVLLMRKSDGRRGYVPQGRVEAYLASGKYVRADNG